mgnify:FL=1
MGLQVDELSTGTRIQMLMAVRLAYIETQESRYKLPILADELLANSDDQRARAIIEALVEISREGRQIFYFTAQHDEVSKWKQVTRALDSPISLKEYYLDEKQAPLSMESGNSFPSTVSEIRLERSIPKPAGSNSYEEYAGQIGVPKFSILRDEPGDLHLWYLMNDADKLHQLLEYGVAFWGPLEKFYQSADGLSILPDDEFEFMAAKVKILIRYAELYRVGRPQPINREVLESSGAVSPSFIDRVSEKMEEVGHNPADLLEALENGEVSGFRSRKIGELREYFVEQNYLDEREPHGMDFIQLQVRELSQYLALTLDETEQFLNRVIG